ncbi:MAG: cyclic nucleotide-binding domain-containing protein [Armatimonadota bacterium]
MEAIQVIDTAHLVTLPSGGALMVGAPPEALKVLVLWEYPGPSVVVLPPDPLFAHGVNQASFEFLLFNHLFQLHGLRDGVPFVVVCDPEQQERVERMLQHSLRGPSDEEMAAYRTPASQRRQLLREMAVVGGPVAQTPVESMARVIAFEDGRAALPDGTLLEELPGGALQVTHGGEVLAVPRRAPAREALPFYFADVDRAVAGPRFGLQVIGSASGFSGAEWGSCFVVWINGQPLIVDGTPYLDEHLKRLGIEDDHILGYLITHNHEDHANALSQLIGRRPVTVLTSGPVMAGLVSRLAAILAVAEEEVRRLFRWVVLRPGTEEFGEPLHWFGAEIRTWYSVHTLPTLGVDIAMDGKRIRLPGDTLWGRQLDPLLEQGVVTPARAELVRRSYEGADVIVADAGGGPIHPDPEEVQELVKYGCCSRLMVTHIPEAARQYLPTADPGTAVTLIPRAERSPEEAMALFNSPVLQHVPERWLLTLLYGGEVWTPGEEELLPGDGAVMVLAGSLELREGAQPLLPLQRGDLFHHSLMPELAAPALVSTARWTRLLRIPEALYGALLRDTGLKARLDRLYQTRNWWREVTGEELGLDTLVELAELSRERKFNPGAMIVRQSEPATHFYVVIDGCVEVSRQNGSARTFGQFRGGYHFGEIALLGEEVRTATVTAVEPTRVLELPGRAFQRLLLDIPLARYRIGLLAQKRRAELYQSD